MHFHVEAAAALSHGSEFDAVGEHFGHGDFGFDDRVATLVVHALDAPAAAVEVAHDGAGEVVGDGDFDVHDGLEQGRLGGLHGLLEGDAAGHLEGEVVGIDVVIRAVVEDDPEIDYRKTSEVAASGGVFDSLFYCGDEVLGDGAAEDVVDEFEFSATGQRLHLYFAIAV